MKKCIALLLILVSVFTLLAACSKEEPEESPSPTVKPVISTPIPTSPSASPSPEVPKVYSGKVANSDNGVNIRKEASTEAEIIRTADTGEVFTVLETGLWCKVQLEDGVGYIHSDFLEITAVT